MSSSTGEAGDLTAAALRVVHGEPDDDELAALVAGIVAARAAADDEDGAGSADGSGPAWSDYGRRLGDRHTPGATTWQWSLHP